MFFAHAVMAVGRAAPAIAAEIFAQLAEALEAGGKIAAEIFAQLAKALEASKRL